MSVINYRNPSLVRKAGMSALQKELGTVGAVYFLRQFETGYGNYTEEREHILDDDTLEDVIKGVRMLDEQS
jgi:hypothetical protein